MMQLMLIYSVVTKDCVGHNNVTSSYLQNLSESGDHHNISLHMVYSSNNVTSAYRKRC